MKKILIFFIAIMGGTALFAQDTIPPSVHVVYPEDGTFSSCSLGDIVIYAWDESTIDFESLFLTCTVGGVPYELHHDVVSRLDTLFYFPYPRTVYHGDTVGLILAPVRDMPFGNASENLIWEFYIDQEAPLIDLVYPVPGEEISESYPDIEFTLFDDMSGVNRDSSYVIISGVEIFLTDSAISRIGDTFTVSLFELGLPLPGGDSVSICIHSADSAVACGANRRDSCFVFTVEPGGPIGELLAPYHNASASCLDSGIVIGIFDEDGILEDSLRLIVDADTLFTGDMSLSWDGELLVLPEIWEGTHTYELLAWDSLFNPLEEPLVFSVTGDTTCPSVILNLPSEEGAILTVDPVFRFLVTDDYSRVFSSPTMFIVHVWGRHTFSDIFTLADPQLTRIGDFFRLDLSHVELQGGDTIHISATVYDSVNICAANGCTTEFEFYIPYSPPSVSVRTPSIGSVISCDSTAIIVRVFDDQPIDPSSIRLQVGSITYTIDDPELSFVDDSLIVFGPSTPWVDGTIVRCSVQNVADILGNALLTDHSWGFTIDLSPPEIQRTDPANLELVVDTTQTITIWFRPDLSGIDESTLSISVDGVEYNYPHPQLYWYGNQLEFTPSESWNQVDTVEVCLLGVFDSPDSLCPPNGCDYCPECWTFYVDGRSPYVTPSDNSVTACDSQTVEAFLWSPLGIDPATIEFVVNGVSYSVDNPELWFEADTLHFGPSVVPWPDGEWVSCSLASASDGLTNIEPFGWRFLVDLSEPLFTTIYPSPEETVTVRTPDISFTVEDETCGLDSLGWEIVLNGVRFGLFSPYVEIRGTEITFDLEGAVGAGIIPMPRGGDVITVQVIAPDNAPPGYCGPNTLDTTWTFYIEASPPVVIHLYPDMEYNTSCATAEGQRVLVLLEDGNGIDEGLLSITVNDTEYDIDTPELALSGDTLTWTPTTPFLEGTVLHITVNDIFDILGNMTDGYSFTITVDNTPPLVFPIYPEPHRIIANTDAEISAIVVDSLSSFGWSIVGTSPIFDRMSGDTLFMRLPEPSAAEDTVEICLALWDSTANCPANTDTFCWSYIVDVVPPTIRPIRPEDSLFASCESETLVFVLTDASGVNPTSIILTHAGEAFRISSPELRYVEDTLYFVPSGGWEHGDTIHVDITNAEDVAGNRSSYEDILTFFIDQMPPVLDITPPDGSVLLSRTPSFSIYAFDGMSGLNPDEFYVNIDGTLLHIGDEGLSMVGDNVLLNFELAGIEYTAGDSFCIITHAEDNIVLCDPNAVDTAFCFSISWTPPLLTGTFPEDNARISCTDTSIVLSFTDTDGLGDSLLLTVNGTGYNAFDPEISLLSEEITIRGVTFEVTNEVCIEYLEDVLGAEMAGLPWCFTFYQDTAPPSYVNFPPESMLTSDPSPEITVSFSDPSGAYPDSISFGGIWYDIDSPYLEIMDEVLQLSFPDGDTIDTGWVEVCVAAHDSAVYCGVNILLECYYFYINISAPQPILINPFDGAVTACADNIIEIFLRDDDGIDESSVLLTVNDVAYDLLDPELTLIDDTLRFDNGTWDAESIFVSLEAMDDLGNMISPPYTFHFFVDTIPPVIDWHTPYDGEIVTPRTPEIAIRATDNRAGIDMENLAITIGDTTEIEGVWSDSLFIFTSPYFLERDTVNITVHSYFDTPDLCDPNQGEPYRFSFIIADDDTLPPELSNANEAGYCGKWLHISEEITDSSDIMEGSVLVTAWDEFGDTLLLDNPMIETEPDIYRSIDSIFVGDIVFYSVTVTDDDFDDDIDMDRSSITVTDTVGCTALDLPIIPGMTGDIGDTCVGDTLSATLGFLNIYPDPVEIDTSFLTLHEFFTLEGLSGNTLDPGDTLWITLLFHPEEETDYLDTLYLFAENLLLPSIELQISAMGMECITQFSFVPNPFTPNGDRYNDEIIAQIPERGEKELRIYDTRNVLIFDASTGDREMRWDGRNNDSKPAAAGSYIYVIMLEGEKYRTGVITLAR